MTWATACATRRGRQRAPWESGQRLANGHPILRMPFPAGTVVLCQQGNLSPPGRTHFKENNRHALDLSNTSVPSFAVVAPAPGRVAYVYAGSDPADFHAGFGYGNQVKVEHGLGYFTMYAHLDGVAVREGDVVDVGDPIGTVGYSGAAGNRHLHFSLHQGNPAGMGVYESTSMDALVTAEMTEAPVFKAMSSTDVRDGEREMWDGALYGSENRRGVKPLSGAAQGELAVLLEGNRKALAAAVADRKALDTVSRERAAGGGGWAEGVVAPILERRPRHAVARYWRATAVDGAAGRWGEAEATYRDLLATGPAEATWETWLVSWCHGRLGAVALERGRVEEARSRFVEAERTATAEPERAFARGHLLRLEGRADGGMPAGGR